LDSARRFAFSCVWICQYFFRDISRFINQRNWSASWDLVACQYGTSLPLHAAGLFADVLGLSFDTFRRVHGAAAWMTSALLALHIVVAMLDQQKFSLHEQTNLFVTLYDGKTTVAESLTDLLQGPGTLAALMLFSLSLFRRLSFELFLRQGPGKLKFISAHRFLHQGCITVAACVPNLKDLKLFVTEPAHFSVSYSTGNR
jgi:hypothetical protein